MQDLIFAISSEKIELQLSDQLLQLDFGLNYIVTQSVRFGRMDALAIEKMIDVIEALLEQLKLDYHSQRIAQTSDVYMRQLSALFFNDVKHIDRSMLEHAFNEWVERLEYYADKAENDFKLWAYFVLIREMMHHLNVVEITIVNR
ncbi:hypothetical protein [Acinetobacter sp. ANC 3813]|uniref:hypothetical protein n=1 Tax=Acinetobacter sp. ANC 3813 TaxID=1977873 RepID=UPI000A338D6F|nr:hypothetical protein [Acinetobacter sp. ANC 3813]OTG90367.1 hypothetical protein B9T34_07600 [Acinetobacter sp. ANC 3813]